MDGEKKELDGFEAWSRCELKEDEWKREGGTGDW